MSGDTLLPRMKRKSSIIIVKNIYHQVEAENPIHLPVRSRIPVESDEQCYDRRLPLSREWKPIDRGWVDQVSMVSVHHSEGVRFTDKPTEKEFADLENRVVEVGLLVHGEVVPVFAVPRDCSTEFTPVVDLDLYRLRLSAGEGKVSVRVYPK